MQRCPLLGACASLLLFPSRFDYFFSVDLLWANSY